MSNLIQVIERLENIPDNEWKKNGETISAMLLAHNSPPKYFKFFIEKIYTIGGVINFRITISDDRTLKAYSEVIAPTVPVTKDSIFNKICSFYEKIEAICAIKEEELRQSFYKELSERMDIHIIKK